MAATLPNLGGNNPPPKKHSWYDVDISKHYMAWTTGVAGGTALANIIFIIAMAVWKLDQGLGLAAIGIITFFGTALSSSIFEEHRHDHGENHDDKVVVGKNVPEPIRDDLKKFEDDKFATIIDKFSKKEIDADTAKKELAKEYKKPYNFIYVNKNDPNKDEDGRFIHGVIAGTGIMRKALAASLVITYIVLIGFSFSSDTLYEKIDGTNNTAIPHLVLPTFEAAGQTDQELNLEEIIAVKDLSKTDQKSDTSSNPVSIETQILNKNPETLVQHFTIVVSVVIGFYFGSNTFSALLEKYKNASGKDQGEITKTVKEIKDRLDKIDPASDKNKAEKYNSILDELEGKIASIGDPITQKALKNILDKRKNT